MSRMTTEHNNGDLMLDQESRETTQYFEDSYYCADHRGESAGDVYQLDKSDISAA